MQLMPLRLPGKQEPRLHVWLSAGSGWSSAVSLGSTPQVGLCFLFAGTECLCSETRGTPTLSGRSLQQRAVQQTHQLALATCAVMLAG